MSALLSDGDYARKQIFCPSRVVRWSHGARFARAERLVAGKAGGRLLDYGCGDGTFIALVHDRFPTSLGVDVDPGQIDECRRRLGALPGVTFDLTRAVDAAPPGTWDAVTCMEVLEHCLEDERRRIVSLLARASAPDGIVVISVPIEIGPALAGKQFFRALAGLRRLGDYAHRERYTPIELMRASLGLALPRVAYEGEGPDGPYWYHGHKGFDYRVLQREIEACMTIEHRLFTPMSWIGPVMNSQAWFVCRSS